MPNADSDLSSSGIGLARDAQSSMITIFASRSDDFIKSPERKFSNIFCVIDYNGYSAILNFFCQLRLQLLLQSFYFPESRIR